MPDNEVVTGFYEIMKTKVVSIAGRTLSSACKSWAGTGCVLGLLRNPNYDPKAVVITAGHVLREATGIPVEWTFRREAGPKDSIKECVFETPHDNPYGPRFTYYGKDQRVDIGVIFADTTCTDGRPFLDWDDQGRPKEAMVPVIPKGLYADRGTRVAWAGFPCVAAREFGAPLLCYYEGVVSAVIDREGFPPLYLLDGHNTWGMSGGPVWAWSDERHQIELIGIVVNYLRNVDEEVELPGHVTAVAIHPIMQYLGAAYPFEGTSWGYAKPGPQIGP